MTTKPEMNEVSALDTAYIAGLIDGEGCLSVSRTRTNGAAKGCKRGLSYRCFIAVRMTDEAVVRWLHATLGVGQVLQVRKAGGSRKAAWAWTAWSREAAAVVKHIREHLKVKARCADNLLSFQDLMRSPGRQGLTDYEWEAREFHYINSKYLNRRGPRYNEA